MDVLPRWPATGHPGRCGGRTLELVTAGDRSASTGSTETPAALAGSSVAWIPDVLADNPSAAVNTPVGVRFRRPVAEVSRRCLESYTAYGDCRGSDSSGDQWCHQRRRPEGAVGANDDESPAGTGWLGGGVVVSGHTLGDGRPVERSGVTVVGRGQGIGRRRPGRSAGGRQWPAVARPGGG